MVCGTLYCRQKITNSGVINESDREAKSRILGFDAFLTAVGPVITVIHVTKFQGLNKTISILKHTNVT